ncbi:organic hydroperoxide resistance transcriptional regulator [Bradyrhizobiaceae bacterium SG-6C]|nr:organic hydroperoxide resistance transcriptional regulator [Bradyrhizobiaceae bacterium SG-6C]
MTKAKPTSSSKGAPRLENFLCFAIYSANLAYGRAYKAILDELGLTYTQYIALVALSEEDNQTVSGLGEKLFLESNTLTPILKNLETMGYVRRQRDPKDERKVVISLTEAGRRVRDKALPLNLVRETQLTPEEFALLQKSVVKLRNNLIKGTKATGKSK